MKLLHTPTNVAMCVATALSIFEDNLLGRMDLLTLATLLTLARRVPARQPVRARSSPLEC